MLQNASRRLKLVTFIFAWELASNNHAFFYVAHNNLKHILWLWKSMYLWSSVNLTRWQTTSGLCMHILQRPDSWFQMIAWVAERESHLGLRRMFCPSACCHCVFLRLPLSLDSHGSAKCRSIQGSFHVPVTLLEPQYGIAQQLSPSPFQVLLFILCIWWSFCFVCMSLCISNWMCFMSLCVLACIYTGMSMCCQVYLHPPTWLHMCARVYTM